jgi:1-acyl-sn-glycerol-3-phosphate acyltransferase
MLGNVKATLKLIILVLWMIACFIPLLLSYKLRKYKMRDRIMSFASGGMLRIIGIRTKVTGLASDIRPLLMVSNHISYLDVLILNAKAPIHFTPKIEISGWPILKNIANMSGSIYIDRRPEKLREGKSHIVTALAAGNMVCIFPEATTGDGLHMVPFKSGFFSLMEEKINGEELTIQPVAVTYSSIRKLPIDITQWPFIAWYGDMELMPHLWNLLKMTPIDAELVFLEPVTLEQYGDRKKLACHCQKVIDESIQSIRGRHRHTYVKPTKFHPRFLRVKN